MDFCFFLLFPFKNSSFAMSHVDIVFQIPPLPWIKSSLPPPASFNPFLIFILIILSSKLFLSFILDLGDLQRNHQNSFESWSQTNSPGQSLVPSTQTHQDPLVLSSKFSKFAHYKFGPELPILVKFIFSLFQKF